MHKAPKNEQQNTRKANATRRNCPQKNKENTESKRYTTKNIPTKKRGKTAIILLFLGIIQFGHPYLSIRNIRKISLQFPAKQRELKTNGVQATAKLKARAPCGRSVHTHPSSKECEHCPEPFRGKPDGPAHRKPLQEFPEEQPRLPYRCERTRPYCRQHP